MVEEPTPPPKRHLLSLVLVMYAVALTVSWPGDVSWLMDEPRLIATAWHANHDWQIATGGLYGNFGIRYGPLPTQIYQLLLLITHNPFALVVLRALLCAGVTGFSLLWLARRLDLPGWFAAGVLVSPLVAHYQRVLWDASFAMPIGALALASFADFLQTRRPWPLRVCMVASVLLPTIHPQSLPLSVALLGWLGWRHRPDLRNDLRALGVAGAIVLLLNGFYFAQFAGQLLARFGGSVQQGYPGGGSHLLSVLAPFLGGNLLSGADFLDNLARPSAPAWLHAGAQTCALLIYPLAWVGILAAGITVRQMRCRRDAMTSRQAVTCVLLAGLAFQALLFGALRIPAAPQYYFGTFPLHVLAALLAVDALRKWRLGAVLGGLYAIGSVILTLEAAISIHRYGFEKPQWPTLSTSVSFARKLNRYSDTTALTDIVVYKKAPQALRTLRLLLPPAKAPLLETGGHLEISHGLMWNFTGMDPVPGSQRIDITPLPKDWVPDPSTW